MKLWRRPQIGNVKRQAGILEYSPYTRKKRSLKALDICFDDRDRFYSRSWKENKKCRHQWEKHKKKHQDTIRRDKRIAAKSTK